MKLVAPTYSEVIRLPIATKLGIKGNGTALEKWASSKMFRRVSRETKHEIDWITWEFLSK